jgi:hypothetical protein
MPMFAYVVSAVVHLRRAAALLVCLTGFAVPRVYSFDVIEVPLQTNDIVYDRFSDRIYATTPSSAGARGNSITPINPATGALGTSVFVGSEPNKLAVSDNGQYLYFGLDGAAAARRFDIATQTPSLQIPLGSNGLSLNYVDDIEVAPGQPNTVAISRRNSGFSPRHEGVVIYVDDVKLPNETPDHTGSNVIEFSNTASVLYGYNNETTDFGFRTMTVNANGVMTTNSTAGLISGFGANFEYAGGRVYSTSGRIIDPVARTLIGSFASGGMVCPDPSGGQVYFLSNNKITSYDINTFLFNWDFTVPGMSGSPGRLVRFGDHGLAFRTTGSEVFLITDPKIGGVPEPSALLLAAVGLTAAITRSRRAMQA